MDHPPDLISDLEEQCYTVLLEVMRLPTKEVIEHHVRATLALQILTEMHDRPPRPIVFNQPKEWTPNDR